jgi:propionyl-CoA synthetase
MFKAIVLDKNEGIFQSRLGELDEKALPEGDVVLAVEFSTINYKDALALANASPIVRKWPMVPGIDGAGTVLESSHGMWEQGDKVILNGWGVGESHWGCLAQKARLKGDWLVRLPMGMTPKQAMSIGTAGYTAMLCALEIERLGITKERGEVLVTGATGGVGSVAVAILAKRGYRVVASTGKMDEAAYLRRLGAAEIIDRKTLSEAGKPLQKERWAAVVDSVGSHTLANACAQTMSEGVVAACGLAQGMDLRTSVAPFILRGVTLRGINSVYAPRELRERAWAHLAKEVDAALLDTMTTEIALSEALSRAPDVLAGRIRGRIVVDVNREVKGAVVVEKPAVVEATKPPKPVKTPRPELEKTLTTAQGFYARSIQDPAAFWMRQAGMIEWWKKPVEPLDYSKPPFRKWFVGGETNLCFNAVDRHLISRADQPALVWISTEVDGKRTFTYAQLADEVNRFAAILKSMGVGKGDRVLIYMPMTPEAVFAMLATVRLGAIHSVVFGGFAAASLAARIDDARPKVLVTSDAGMRMGKTIPLKPLVDESIKLAKSPPHKVLVVDRGIEKGMTRVEGRDVDYAAEREKHAGVKVPVVWLESNEPSYILYTSGTTGNPKGVLRDTGGYAVALAASMKNIFCSNPGEAYFCTSDIGWVVGHSYIVYGPLINGSTTIMYEGVPVRPDPGIWWRIVEEYKVTSMFSSPTAIRVLKKQDAAWMRKHDTTSLRYLFLAGEPLDEPTARWVSESLGCQIVDNYWQTESGWPILTACPGVEDTPRKFGSPSFPAYGYQVKLKHEETGAEVGVNEKGVLCIIPPLPPGAMSTIWGDDERYVQTYYRSFEDELVYTTFDWATRDKDGYYFVLGRTDDVINVAGHRLGTREIEEAIQAHTNVAEVAVVGVSDPVKGQVPVAFAVVKDASKIATPELASAHEKEIMATVDREIGAIARPSRVCFVTLLPKTRSGKLLRRSIQAICEGRDPGDLTTIEDPGALEQVRAAAKP